MWGTFVRQNSSAGSAPRSPSVDARLPPDPGRTCSGACRCRAGARASSVRSRPSSSTSRTSSGSSQSTAAARPFLITSRPRRRNTSSSTSDRSGSSFGSSWSRAETSVTREPQREKKSANSQPVGPAPSTTRCSGRSRRSNTCRVVSTRRASGWANGGTNGEAPVHTSSASNSIVVVAAVHVCDQLVRAGDAAAAGQDAHVHAVHALAHAAALVQRDGPRPGERPAQVDRRVAVREVEAVLLGPRHLEHRVGGRQERLRRDRVGHRAVAAERHVLDERDVGAQVRGGRGRGVAGRSAAKDDEPHARHRRLRTMNEIATLLDPAVIRGRVPVAARRPCLPRQPRRHPGARGPSTPRSPTTTATRTPTSAGRSRRPSPPTGCSPTPARRRPPSSAPHAGEIVFGANMTTLTMHASRTLFRDLGPGDEVLVTGPRPRRERRAVAARRRGSRRDRAPGRDRPRRVRRRPERVRRPAQRPHARGRVRLGVERRRHRERRRRPVRAVPRGGRALLRRRRPLRARTGRSTSPRSGATSSSARRTSSSARTSASCSGGRSCSSATARTRCARRRTSRRTRGRRARSTSRASPARRPRSPTCRRSGMDAVAAYERGLTARLLDGLRGDRRRHRVRHDRSSTGACRPPRSTSPGAGRPTCRRRSPSAASSSGTATTTPSS